MAMNRFQVLLGDISLKYSVESQINSKQCASFSNTKTQLTADRMIHRLS